MGVPVKYLWGNVGLVGLLTVNFISLAFEGILLRSLTCVSGGVNLNTKLSGSSYGMYLGKYHSLRSRRSPNSPTSPIRQIRE